MKLEFKIIADLLEENTRILDVGCDDGTLMEFLKSDQIFVKSLFRLLRCLLNSY